MQAILQIESVAMRFRSRGPRGGFNNEEVAGGSEGLLAPLLRQEPRLRQKCCRPVRAGSLFDHSVLLSLKGLAARYAPGPPPGKPSPPLAFQNVGVGRRVCHFNSSSMRILARGIDSGSGGRRPLQIESVAARFRNGGLRGGFNNGEVAGGSECPRASPLRQVPRLLQMWCRAVHAGSFVNYNIVILSLIHI